MLLPEIPGSTFFYRCIALMSESDKIFVEGAIGGKGEGVLVDNN